MGRRPNYQGGSSIEYMRKGKHYDCRHRSEDGDCMDRASKWFGFMCRDVNGKCEDYYTLNVDALPISKIEGRQKDNAFPKPAVYIQKNINVVENGDLVSFHSVNKNIDVEFIIDDKDISNMPLFSASIGKSIGYIIYYNGNKYIIKSIKCKK